MKLATLSGVYCLYSFLLCAQNASLTGEIAHGEGTVVDSLQVELYEHNAGVPTHRASVTLDGKFEFNAVKPGAYLLRVTTTRGGILQEEFVQVRENGFPITIRLSDHQAQRPGGAISAARLAHKTPREAREELHRALKASKANDLKRSIEHLENAVRTDPEYLEALNVLGTEYMLTSLPNRAVPQFEKMIAIDPNIAVAHLNLSASLLMLARAPEAEREARIALKLEPSSTKAEYLLALSLVNEGRQPEEALQNLHASEHDFPQARLAAATLYVKTGKIDQARGELREYVAEKHAPYLAQAEAWLKRLQ